MTTRSVRARFRNGVLEPIDPVNLTEEQVVLLTFDDQTARRTPDTNELYKSAGAWAGQFDDHEQLIRDIYQARIDGTPPSRRPWPT